MRRQATCNLLATLSRLPWTESACRGVYMTPDGEKRIPFYAYVQSDNTYAASLQQVPPLLAFCRLPEEIQLRILAMCSASSLFQLMHTSSKLRVESSKLFWAKADAYFLVEAHWLNNGASIGRSFWDPTFFAYVQYVEVECRAGIRQEICVQRDNVCDIQHHLIHTFWTSLKKRFPKVKRVLLNYNEENISQNEDPVPLALQLLLQACPPGIEASILLLERVAEPRLTAGSANWRTATWQRRCFRFTSGEGWHESISMNFRQIILMPSKRFMGPVGCYNGLKYQLYLRIRLQRFGLWPLAVGALDRHHFNTGCNAPFTCPLPSCTVSFLEAGEWTVHAAKAHYQEWKKLLEALPDSSVGDRLKRRRQELETKTKDVQDQFKKIKDAWFDGDEATQMAIKRSWLDQLSNDAAWECEGEGEQNVLWLEFMRDLHSGY